MFCTAVNNTPGLEGACRKGLQALASDKERDRIRCSSPRGLCGSVNLDAALKDRYPNDPRWDYGIGWKDKRTGEEMAIWVEFHDANSHHVNDVIAKAQWLRGWLTKSAPELYRITRRPFRWIATGSVVLTRHSPQARRLAQAGLSYPSRMLNLDSLE